jgi:hypothetical protein
LRLHRNRKNLDVYDELSKSVVPVIAQKVYKEKTYH